MTYLGFPVTLGYLEQITLKGGVPYVHHGIDLGSFTGDEIKVGNVVIGLGGETGMAEGPHTHVQAGRDEWAQATLDPSDLIGKPGTVVKTGYADQWGNYVCIKVGDVNVFYCHLSKILVQVGTVITGDDMNPTREDVRNYFLTYLKYEPSEKDVAFYTSRRWNELATAVIDTALGQANKSVKTLSDAESKLAQIKQILK